MKKIIATVITYAALTNMGFTAEEIKDDIEMGLRKYVSTMQTQLDLLSDKDFTLIHIKINQGIYVEQNANHNENEEVDRQGQNFNLLNYARKLVELYGIQTAVGLTVSLIVYKCFY